VTGETVTILRPGSSTRDPHGNDVPGADVETDVEHCAVWPTGSDEQVQGQDQVTDRMSVLFPYGTTVYATDRLWIRGLVYQVAGVSQSWSSPFTGTRAGVEVQADRVTG
jgi:hypothetical protein